MPTLRDYTFFSYKNMISRSEPQKEIEIATNKITTMFLNFGKSEPQRSYKHGSYKKKKWPLSINYQKICKVKEIEVKELYARCFPLLFQYYYCVTIIIRELRLKSR